MVKGSSAHLAVAGGHGVQAAVAVLQEQPHGACIHIWNDHLRRLGLHRTNPLQCADTAPHQMVKILQPICAFFLHSMLCS